MSCRYLTPGLRRVVWVLFMIFSFVCIFSFCLAIYATLGIL